MVCEVKYCTNLLANLVNPAVIERASEHVTATTLTAAGRLSIRTI